MLCGSFVHADVPVLVKRDLAIGGLQEAHQCFIGLHAVEAQTAQRNRMADGKLLRANAGRAPNPRRSGNAWHGNAGCR